MSVLADTPVWSAAFRRASDPGDPLRGELQRLIGREAVVLIGPIRQELLSGIRIPAQFDQLRQAMRAFPGLPLATGDHELAARYFNLCRGRGVQGSLTDFLLCAVAVRHRLEIFTPDPDFLLYQRHLPIALYAGAKA